MDKPEFSHRIAISEVGNGRTTTLTADATSREKLARRFGLVALQSLEAEAELSAKAAGIEAHGRLHAQVTQSCVASGAPVEQTVDEPFHILFTPPNAVSGDEIELSSEDCDQMEHDGHAIDLGEAVAQTLALVLDPFPRAPDAEAVLAQAGVVPEGEEAVGPFAVLKALKK